MANERSQFGGETIVLAILGLLLVGAGVTECLWAYHSRAPVAVARVEAPAALPALPAPAAEIAETPKAAVAPLPSADALVASLEPNPADETVEPSPSPAVAEPKSAPASAPLPPHRPAALGGNEDGRPAPSLAPGAIQAEISARYDRATAVYDLTAHMVYLPNGARLEAHSGLGDRLDDPRYVDEQDKGATPPHVYELTLREQPFHGVQALRLTPVGGASEIFGRAGLLAHTYMLGPRGDSNGCVSFKDYDAFLQAFQDGQVKRLAVVARL